MNVVLPKYTSLKHLQADLKNQKITCVELAQYYLSRIKSTSHLNIYIQVYEKEVLDEAARQDKIIQAGNYHELGKLHGMIINHKDVICVKGHPVSAGSKILESFESLYSATAIQKILDQDAMLIGRVNCDEFAMGSSNQNSNYGPTKNPHNEDYIPGGSSGASAVSVAVDTCLASLGSDTGGSVRQPASFCGVYGMKPSYGALSRYGLIAYGSSFDQIGFLSHSIEVIDELLRLSKGKDPLDATSIEIDAQEVHNKKYTYGYFSQLDDSQFLDGTIHEAFTQFKKYLVAQGHQVTPVEFPLLDYLVPAYYILTTAEASSNLSRYDGVRYGHRASQSKDMHAMYKNSRTEGFGTEVKRRLMMGTYVLSAGYYEAYYNKAQKVRRLLVQSISDLFKQVDYIINPVTPNKPWKIGENLDDPIKVYLSDVLTVYVNLVGLPSLSLPWSKDELNLPIGMQITGPRKKDFNLLSSCKEIF